MTVQTALVSIIAQIGLNITNPQASSTSTEIQQIVELMNETGRDIAARADWSRMFKVAVIPAGASIALPADFLKLADSAPVWLDKPTFKAVRRAMEPEQWAFLSKTASVQPYFYMENGALTFAPPIDADGGRLRYLSNAWSDAGATITQNGDNFLIPERLIVSGTVYRWNRQKGLPFDDIMAEHEADILDEIAMDRGAQ